MVLHRDQNTTKKGVIMSKFRKVASCPFIAVAVVLFVFAFIFYVIFVLISNSEN